MWRMGWGDSRGEGRGVERSDTWGPARGRKGCSRGEKGSGWGGGTEGKGTFPIGVNGKGGKGTKLLLMEGTGRVRGTRGLNRGA